MGKRRKAYPAEYRARMVELVRSGRKPDELAEEFEPSGESIRRWVLQAEIVAALVHARDEAEQRGPG
jgi:transposase